jgi:hypothetical protein
MRSRRRLPRQPRVDHADRKPTDGSELPKWKEELNAAHRKVRARVGHTLAHHMKCWKILRDYRHDASTLTDAVSGIDHLHNVTLAGLSTTVEPNQKICGI